MSQINSYLTFGGNCREAMNFDKDCLGGHLDLQTIGESPLAGKMPQEMKDCILHAALTNDKIVLLGSDMVPESGLLRGNSISLMLDCKSETEIEDYYNKLSSGGKPTFPLEKTFFGAILGGLSDKYGNPWLLHFKSKEK